MGVNMHYQKIIIFILIMTCFLAARDYTTFYPNSTEDSTNTNPQTNNSFPFQGYFTDYLGRPYFGTVLMGFEFFADEAGENSIYSGDLVRSVKVYNGLYATKVSLPKNAFAILAEHDNIWVKVYIHKGLILPDAWNTMKDAKDAYVLKPLVQLTAAPYALGVRGLYYEQNNFTSDGDGLLKIGQGYKNFNTGSGHGLIISGNVRINTANATEDDKNIKLVVDDLDMYGRNIRINGEIYAPGGVYGAVWN
jgi:hypothetical protein